LCFVLAGCGGACGGGEEAARTSAEQSSSPAAEPPAPASPAELAPVLDAYETLCASLAEGNVERLFEQSATLEAAASQAAAGAPEAQKRHLEELATAAARLAETPRGDVTEARRSFGEVSRHLVALTGVAPTLGEGLQVYTCERALGFQSWVQRRGDMRSPYTDDSCGSPATP
jgi:plasmid stabilization system protein ParE